MRFFIYFPVIMWGMSIACTLVSSATVLVLSTALFIYPILSHELRHRQKSYATIPELRQRPQHVCLVYRALEIYVKNLLIRFGSILLPMQALVSQFILILNYILIKHGHEMSWITIMVAVVWSLACQIVWITLLTLASTFHKEAVATRSWKGFEFRWKSEKRYMAKCARSCRPLYIGTGEVFQISKRTVLKFLQGLVRGTFRALVTLK